MVITGGLAGAMLITTFVAMPASAVSRSYPLHTAIISTTFWVGEVFDSSAADGSQVCSTYDGQWAKRWSGRDNGSKASAGTDCSGAPLGGCDGIPTGAGATFRCATEPRKAANGYFPSSAAVVPLQNPFYLDLPFDDLNDDSAFATRAAVIPWANDSGYAGNKANHAFSYMKNRWVAITKGAYTCYAQVEDAGPGEYDDQAYVFGTANARPSSTDFNNAGMDVSPAVNGCLHYSELDGEDDSVNWKFVEAIAVPAGPWTRIVTTSQVDGAVPSAAYKASILPPSGSTPPVPSTTTVTTSNRTSTTAPTTKPPATPTSKSSTTSAPTTRTTKPPSTTATTRHTRPPTTAPTTRTTSTTHRHRNEADSGWR